MKNKIKTSLKRPLNKKSLVLVLIIQMIAVGIIENFPALNKTRTVLTENSETASQAGLSRMLSIAPLTTLAVAFVSVIFGFLIFNSLLYHRNEGLGERFSSFGDLNFKKFGGIFLVDVLGTILVTGGFALIGVFVMKNINVNPYLQSPDHTALVSKKASLAVTVLFFILLMLFYSVISFYKYAVFADKRNENETLLKNIKTTFKTGLKLFAKTLLLFLKYIAIFTVSFFVLLFIFLKTASFADNPLNVMAISSFLIIIFSIVYTVYSIVKVYEVASNYYMDHTNFDEVETDEILTIE